MQDTDRGTCVELHRVARRSTALSPQILQLRRPSYGDPGLCIKLSGRTKWKELLLIVALPVPIVYRSMAYPLSFSPFSLAAITHPLTSRGALPHNALRQYVWTWLVSVPNLESIAETTTSIHHPAIQEYHLR